MDNMSGNMEFICPHETMCPTVKNLIDSMWPMIKDVIVDILEKNMKCPSFQEMSRSLYHVELENHRGIYTNLKETVSTHLEDKVLVHLLNSLDTHFVQTLNKCWSDTQSSMGTVVNFIMYQDRMYVRSNEICRNCILSIGRELFCDIIIQNDFIKEHLRDTMMGMVLSERNGKFIDYRALKSVCEILEILESEDKRVYEEIFECPFLAQSSEFYAVVSQKLLALKNASKYVQNALCLLDEESERTEHYLPPYTQNRLIKVVEKELVEKHMKTIIEMEDSGFIYMIKNHQLEDLTSMYKLFIRKLDSHESGGLPYMLDCLRVLIQKETKLLMKVNGPDTSPVDFIQNVIDLKDKLDLLKLNALRDRFSQLDIYKDLDDFLNTNPRSPEYLSIYFDEKMKKICLTMDQVDLPLHNAMSLFLLLKDKNMLLMYYKRHLAERLLFLNKSVDEEKEKYFVLKLRAEFGCKFTSKMDSIFVHINNAKTIVDSFNEHLTVSPLLNSNNIKITVRVLPTNYWPILTIIPKINIPSIARLAYEEFQTFYSGIYNGRKLVLLPQQGTAYISAIFYENHRDDGSTVTLNSNDRGSIVSTSSEPEVNVNDNNHSSTVLMNTHIFKVSTYQMAILMLFNSYEELTMETIMNKTGINQEDLIRELEPLVFGKPSQKLLLMSPRPRKKKDYKKIELHYKFFINESYTSKLYRVRIQSSTVMKESELEFDKTLDILKKNKDNELDKMILKIIRSHEPIMQLPFHYLVVELMERMKIRFIPSPMDIQRRLKYLVDMNYLIHIPEDLNSYRYVA